MQTINVGAAANDGTGDPLRTAFQKVNANFGQLDAGKEAAGTAAAAVASHAGQSDPHPQYTTAGEAAAAAPVQSVAGRTGAVTLAAADLADATALGRYALTAPADRRPPLYRPRWATLVGAWRAGYGTTSRLTDATGNGADLVLTGGLAPTLLPTDTPAGGAALSLDGTQTLSATVNGVNRHGLVVVLVTRPTANGVLFDDSDGWRVTLQVSDQAMQFGQLGGEVNNPAATRQYSVLVGWYGSHSTLGVQPSCNQRGGGAGVPGAAAAVPGIRLRGSQRFVALILYQMADAAAMPSGADLAEICETAYPLILPVGPLSLGCRGNSILAGVGLPYADTVVGRLAAALPGWRVGSAAVPSAMEQQLVQYGPAQADAFHPTADLYTELTNNLAFGADAGNGANAAARFLASVRARTAARPSTKHVVWDCLPRTDLGGGQATYDTQRAIANAAVQAAFGVATADPLVWLSGDPTLAGVALCRVSGLPLTYLDGAHPDAPGNGTLADLTVQAMGLLGLTV